jgi:SAM-dependent methyltransferase
MQPESSQKSIIALASWLDTAAGRYVLGWEQSRLDALTSNIFGFNAMQIGLPQVSGLQSNRMPHRWLSDSTGLSNQNLGDQSPPGCLRTMPISVVHDYAELPFASQSLDLVVLPHILEFVAEPHQVLREVERVLIPEGQLIVCGFNPASLWGARQIAGRVSGAHFLPRDGEFISPARMKDWLKLLNMEINRGHFGCYAPPCNTERWLNRYHFMEKAGDRWWPYFGAVYMIQAIKRIKGMRLIGPAWKHKPRILPNAIPASNRSTKA